METSLKIELWHRGENGKVVASGTSWIWRCEEVTGAVTQGRGIRNG